MPLRRAQPDLFRAMYQLAFNHFDVDGEACRLCRNQPGAHSLSDADLPAVLDQFDARQMLHVTFGSALARYRDRIKAVLRDHEEVHYTAHG